MKLSIPTRWKTLWPTGIIVMTERLFLPAKCRQWTGESIDVVQRGFLLRGRSNLPRRQRDSFGDARDARRRRTLAWSCCHWDHRSIFACSSSSLVHSGYSADDTDSDDGVRASATTTVCRSDRETHSYDLDCRCLSPIDVEADWSCERGILSSKEKGAAWCTSSRKGQAVPLTEPLRRFLALAAS